MNCTNKIACHIRRRPMRLSILYSAMRIGRSERQLHCKIWRLAIVGLLAILIVNEIGISRGLTTCQGQVHDSTAIELSGFSVSETFMIPENIPFEIEEPNFQKLLYRVLQTSERSLTQFAKYTADVPWENLLSNNPEYRAQVFQRSGKVTQAEQLTLPGAELGDPIQNIFKLTGQLDDGQVFHLISLNLQGVWLNRDTLDQPIRFTGFLYTLIQANESSTAVPMFVAKRIAWFPQQVDSDLGVTASHVMLAKQGVDIGGIETIKSQHGKKLTAIESPFFFQFLSAVENIPADNLPEPLGAVELLMNFRQAHGKAVRFQARVRQCSIVQRPPDSSDPGFDQYYQLIVFPDLTTRQSEQTIPLIPNTLDVVPPIEVTDGQRTLTYSRFPFTICARSLPAGMSPADIENQQVMIEGFFYRFWKYEAEYTEAMGASGQLSPLIIVNQPRVVTTSTWQLNTFINSILIFFLAILLFAGWTSWRINQRRNRIAGDKLDGAPLPDKIDTRNFDTDS